MKRWLDEWAAVCKQLEEELNWEHLDPAKRRTINRNLLLCWIVAPPLLYIAIWFIDSLFNG